MSRLRWAVVAGVVLGFAHVGGGQVSRVIFSSQGAGDGDSEPLNHGVRTFQGGTVVPGMTVACSVAYGLIDWEQGGSSAGLQWRLVNNSYDYEHLGHSGWGVFWDDAFWSVRGLVRYDADTFISLSTQQVGTNLNGVVPPSLVQLEYRGAEDDDEQLWNKFGGGFDAGGTLMVPGDGTYPGAALTGVLQIADSTGAGYDEGPNFRVVDDADSPGAGGLYDGTAGAEHVNQDGRAVEVAVFYRGNENIVYVTQFEGRIYRLAGPKALGYRRADQQPGGPFDSGLPTIGDTEASVHGRGLSVGSLFSEAGVGAGRHYTGLAVDAGGRVYAVSNRMIVRGTGREASSGDKDPSQWDSEAMLDIYRADGAFLVSVGLNGLVLPTGQTLGETVVSAEGIVGFISKGDVEVDPDVAGVLPADVTRLWVAGMGGDGDNANGIEGLDLLVVDVRVGADGSIVSVGYVGGIDSGTIDSGQLTELEIDVDGWDAFIGWRQFSDIEFDGSGNLVMAGGYGLDGNVWTGVAAGELGSALAGMSVERAGGEDAVVDAAGFDLDMDIYGYFAAFGMAFADVRLINAGSGLKRGDLDLDGDVDLDDWQLLAGYLSGPGVSVLWGCDGADIDQDGDVDLDDWDLLAGNFGSTTGGPGDIDMDGDVDDDDVELFVECMSGPGLAYPAGGRDGDLDGDGDCDLADVNVLLMNFTGAGG